MFLTKHCLIINFSPLKITCENICIDIIYTSHLIVAREGEMIELIKQTTELEVQNAILIKHIEGMKHAIEKLEVEAVLQRSSNMAIQGHLKNCAQPSRNE